ncbi:MAG: 3-dehydroquinate synthase [Lachnospiraceae bacterium]|nr:3-dehydroquinate synthase [Lachnospiraceae bacterium]
MTVNVNLPANGYDIKIERGILKKAGEELKLNRKVLIVTDDGVPSKYAETLAKECNESFITVIKQGEESKNFDNFLLLQKVMLENGFSRKDCAVALGGGVIGDLTGFAASCFMRGIDFYNIPTTVLSQVDSSVGGKTAVDFMGVKNIVGTFYQPKKVLIDPDVLETLDKRQISAGLVEAIKMAATFDEESFAKFEEAESLEDLDIVEVIAKAIRTKADVVEKDEKEAGLRKVLNFGHTLGHGIEAACADVRLSNIWEDAPYDKDIHKHGLLHGECVGIGMLAMCDANVKERIEKVLNKLDLPTKVSFDFDKALSAVTHDKKQNGKAISCVYVKKIGSFELKDMMADELSERLSTLEVQ